MCIYAIISYIEQSGYGVQLTLLPSTTVPPQVAGSSGSMVSVKYVPFGNLRQYLRRAYVCNTEPGTQPGSGKHARTQSRRRSNVCILSR